MEKYLFREITVNLARNDPKHKNANNQFLVNPEKKRITFSDTKLRQIRMFRGKVVSSLSRTYQSLNVRTPRSLKTLVIWSPTDAASCHRRTEYSATTLRKTRNSQSRSCLAGTILRCNKILLRKWAKVTMGFSTEAKILENQRGENERRDICKSADWRKFISKSAYDGSLREVEEADWTAITNFFKN
jgi:hypothetical protein